MWRHKRLRDTTVTVLAYQFAVDDGGYIHAEVPGDAEKIMMALPNNYEFVEPFEPDEALVRGSDDPPPVDDHPPSDDPTFGVPRSRTHIAREKRGRR